LKFHIPILGLDDFISAKNINCMKARPNEMNNNIGRSSFRLRNVDITINIVIPIDGRMTAIII